MRDLRFRAWDGKRYHYSDFALWDGAVYRVLVDTPDVNDVALTSEPVPWAAQQFTGLLDKNGKEIYEGDIVKFKGMELDLSDKWVTAYIEHDGGCSLSLIGITPVGFEGCDYALADIDITADFKVIGNIYQNPELVTP